MQSPVRIRNRSVGPGIPALGASPAHCATNLADGYRQLLLSGHYRVELTAMSHHNAFLRLPPSLSAVLQLAKTVPWQCGRVLMIQTTSVLMP